jgi:DNA-binding CsgD family transcriptional regulator
MTKQEQLSQRETDVTELILQSKSNKQIATVLNISIRTVEFHLSNIYDKLGVASRTEAALKLADTFIRESTGENLRETTVDGLGKSPDNQGKTISRRIPMKNVILVIGGTLLAAALVVTLALAYSNANKVEIAPTSLFNISTQANPTFTQSPAKTSQEHILGQIYQLADEYDKAVQAEKRSGRIEFSKNLTTGDEIFFFKDQSYIRISELFSQFLEQKTNLENLYTQIYRDEFQPTPFPTQSSPEQDKAYYEFLTEQAGDYCSLEAWQQDNQAKTVLAYDPDEGKYRPIFISDTIARCEVYGQMLEEFRVAPMMAKINQESDIIMIRQIIGNPDLRLSFKTISPLANAPWTSVAIYTDETGTKYYVDIETARLVSIEMNFPSHPEIPSNQVKNVDELRSIAEQFAFANSSRLVDLQSILLYEENSKGNIYFFRWDYRNRDWSGTDWSMMPPFLQVGILLNGQIVTYVNTLDMFK